VSYSFQLRLSVCLSVFLSVRALRGKRLELSTSRHGLTLRSKGQRLRLGLWLLMSARRGSACRQFVACWLQGDVVSLLRCVDTNWFEGELSGRRGLFPVSYVEQLADTDLSPVTSPLPLSTLIIWAVFILTLLDQFTHFNYRVRKDLSHSKRLTLLLLYIAHFTESVIVF